MVDYFDAKVITVLIIRRKEFFNMLFQMIRRTEFYRINPPEPMNSEFQTKAFALHSREHGSQIAKCFNEVFIL